MSENLIGATTAIFPIRLSVAVASPVDVEWATRDGSAIAGSDYKAASGTVTFLPGETEKQIEVQVYGQAITPADDKVFFIRLNPPSNAVLVDAILTCTINIIDDQGIPSVAVVVAEGRRGPKGDPGLSAYDQAVLMGYTGTLAEWMDQIADASKAADRAEDYAISAGEDALKAQNAAKNAVFAGVIFPTTAEGVDPILGVQNGAYFNVRSPLSNNYIDEYQNVNGVAVATGKSYPTAEHVQNISEHTALPFVPGESYALNRRVQLDNGDIVKSTVDGNLNDPNVDMTGWRKPQASESFDESGKTQQEINDQWIDATKYLKRDDATYNVTQLRLLIEVAKAQGKGIKHDPTTAGIPLNDDIDFSGIRNIDFKTSITLPLEKQILFGGTAASGAISEVYFKSISDGTVAIPTRPMLKFNGVKQCRVYVGACNYLQVFADTSSSITNSTAYNVFNFGGIIRKLELTNSGVNGWINENHFYDGRVIQLVLTGEGYSHNHNLFFATSIEGSTSTITMTGVSDNHMQNIRMESMPAGSVNFGADTFNNTIEKSWNGSGSIRNNFTNAYVGTNLGRGNIVVQKGSEHYDVTEIFSITPVGIVGNIYGSASPNPYIGAVNESYSSAQLFTPKINSVAFLGGRFLGLSDLIPVDLNTVFNYRAKFTGSLVRMYVQCFNAQRKLITEDIGAVSMYLRSFVAETGYYINSSNLNAEQLSNGFAIESDQVKYVRVGVFSISAGEVESLSCQLITQKHGNNLQKPFVQNIRETAVISGGITQGYAKKGQKFYDTLYRKDNTCLFDMRVSATSGSSAGATSVNMGRSAEASAGDVVGIQQNDGTTHWSKVVSVSGTGITIQNELTAMVSIGNAVVVNRWSILSSYKVHDFPSLAGGAVQTTTIPVLGAKIGQKVDVLLNQPLQGTILYGDVSSDGVVTVYHQNPTAAAVDVASGNLRAVVY